MVTLSLGLFATSKTFSDVDFEIMSISRWELLLAFKFTHFVQQHFEENLMQIVIQLMICFFDKPFRFTIFTVTRVNMVQKFLQQ